MNTVSRRFRSFTGALALAFTFLVNCTALHADVKLAGIIGDNMILQRDADTPVWGTADAGDTITLTLEDQKITAVADANGKWTAVFKELKPGVSMVMTVAGKANTITVNNVAVGDVWICSGQSNMQFPLVWNPAYKDDVNASEDPNIRYYAVRDIAAAEPASESLDHWQVANPDSRRDFTAVGYFFAKHLQHELGVPIGVIRCGWSGANITPFIPLDTLEANADVKVASDDSIAKYRNLASDAQKFADDYKAWQEKYGRADTENKGFAAKWADPAFNDKDWTPIAVPGIWGPLGAPEGGVVWVRKTIQLPPEAAGHGFNLHPGPIERGTDLTYFNGELVGQGIKPPYFWRDYRDYEVPGRLVKAGDNVIAIRIVEQTGWNGAWHGIESFGLPRESKSITDGWLAKIETAYAKLPPDADKLPEPPYMRGEGAASGIFNGTINPLIPYGIKGAVWYQGETSPGGFAYRTLLPLLVKGWRDKWNIGDFPFYIVQLPNLGTPPKNAGEGDTSWAEVREAQLLTSLKVPNTGLAVTIDVGQADNLHPPDKKDVGDRLALLALANTYGQKIEASGPIYDAMQVEGNKIRLKFTHLGGGLVAKDGPLKQFVICGEDKKWAWGDAVIDGNTIVVSSASVPAPVAVRYAWANEPEGCNLYNKAGLPASPFRTDDWPMGSTGKW